MMKCSPSHKHDQGTETVKAKHLGFKFYFLSEILNLEHLKFLKSCFEGILARWDSIKILLLWLNDPFQYFRTMAGYTGPQNIFTPAN